MSLTAPTVDELYEAAKAEIMSVDATLNDFRDGSNLDALASAIAVVGDETMMYALSLHRARFLDTAQGDDLDALGVDRFDMPRLGAAQAVGYVYWTEGSASGYAIPVGTTLRGTLDDGSTYEVTTTAEVVSDSGLPVPVQAVTAGRGGNVPAFTLTTIVGFGGTDPTASITQPERMAGGAPAESDTAYRARLRTFFTSLSTGNRAAYVRATLSVPGVAQTSVVEVPTSGALIVQIYVADAEGAGNSALVSLVNAAIQDPVRALGVLCVVTAAAREEVALAVSIKLRRGADYATVLAAVAASIAVYVDTLPAGETLYASKVAEVAHRASTDVISVTVTNGDVEPTNAYNSVRLTGGTPTLTYTV